MILQAFPAPSDLSPFVSGYLYGHSNFKDSQLLPTIPRGVPALMIIMNEDNEEHIQYFQLKKSSPLKKGVYLCGQATQTWWIKLNTCQAYMVVLKPAALQQVMGESGAVFNDSFLRLDDLLPACKFLPEQLNAEKSQMGQLSVLDKYLRRLFRDQSLRLNEVDVAVHSIILTQGQVKVRELATQERVSVRTLNRKFTEQVGLSPKQYARIVRFRAIINYLISSPGASWLDVTYKFGFHDQAHFIKDFQLFTCLTPNQYFAIDQSFDGQFVQAISKL
ncbi:helix-turn-helix domain-containing protein [Pontibacter toksunensis]|uniref:Helix-turn-helix domain-containing protein n=1 Tax=Pontibacter toksunensis TaxID=1332631 RepID=A0ABW6BZR0_9BACT